MSVFVSDTLKNPPTSTSLLSDHVGQVGATWTNHPASTTYTGRWRFVTDKVYSSGTGSSLIYASGIPQTDEYTVTAQYYYINGADTGAGPAARISPTANTMYYVFYASSGAWVLSRVVNGAYTSIATVNVTPLAAYSFVVVRLECGNSTKKVYVDNQLIISTTDTAITDKGRVGLAANAAIATLPEYGAGTQIYSISASDYFTPVSVSDSDTASAVEGSMTRSAIMSISDSRVLAATESNILMPNTQMTLFDASTIGVSEGFSVSTTLPRPSSEFIGSTENLSYTTAAALSFSDDLILGATEDRSFHISVTGQDSRSIASTDHSVVDAFPSLATSELLQSEDSLSELYGKLLFSESPFFIALESFPSILTFSTITSEEIVTSVENMSVVTSGDGVFGESVSVGVVESFFIERQDVYGDSSIIDSGEDFSIYHELNIYDDTPPLTALEGIQRFPSLLLNDEAFLTEQSDIITSSEILTFEGIYPTVEDVLSFFVSFNRSDTDTITDIASILVTRLLSFSESQSIAINESLNIITDTPPILNELNEDDIRNRSMLIHLAAHRTIGPENIVVLYRHEQISDETVPTTTWFVVIDDLNFPLAIGWAISRWDLDQVEVDISTQVNDYPDVLLSFGYAAAVV